MEPNEPVQPQENPAPETASPPPEAAAPAADALPSAFSLFKPSWEAFKLNWLTLVSLYLLPVVLFLVGAIATGASLEVSGTSATTNDFSGGVLIVLLLTVLVSLLVYPAMTHTQLQSVRGQKVSFGQALGVGKKFILRTIGLAIVAGVLIVLGFIALIVPGLILITKFFFSYYVMIDQDLGVVEALKTSSGLVKGRAMAVWGLVGVSILINLPSFIPIIGSIVALVLTLMYFCAPALRYDQLKALGPQAKS